MTANKIRQNLLHPGFLWSLGFMLLIGLAVSRVHLRVQTTLIGYELGQLKNKEAELLEQSSYLKMQLAKLTTKKHLTLMAESKPKTKIGETLVQNH